METHKAKRVEITIEAVMETRLTDALVKAGVTGFTILPVLGGSGRSGQWSREGQVSRGDHGTDGDSGRWTKFRRPGLSSNGA